MHPAGITGCSRFTVVQRPRLRGRGEGGERGTRKWLVWVEKPREEG